MSGKQIALAAIVFVFTAIVFQMYLPWPFGLIAAAALASVFLIRRKSVTQTRPSSTPLPPLSRHSDDTQFYVCPRCGKDTEIQYGKQYCLHCKMYL